MPNWCNNNLVIETDNTQGFQIVKELELFCLKVQDNPEEVDNTGLLNYFRQMPFTLEGTVKGIHRPKWQTDNSQWLKDCYGYDNWYDWRVNNWGTKWDVHDISSFEVTDEGVWQKKPRIELEFETALAPPIEALQYWIKNLSIFCNVKCYLSYTEPGMDYCGVYVAHEDKDYHQSEYSNNKDLPSIPKLLADIWVAGEIEAEFFEPDDDDDDTDKDLFSKVKNDNKKEVA